MGILAVITEPQQVRKILLHLIKTGKAPPGLVPASGLRICDLPALPERVKALMRPRP
jgi:hypothetical protein